MRPTAALFPLAGIIACRAGGERAVEQLVLTWCAMQLCGLCAADCFRNAASGEPGVRRVDRRFGGAIVQLLLGVALAALLSWLCPAARGLDAGLFAAAGCVLVEQLFEERMWALGRRLDGTLLSVIANLLLLAGLLLDAAGGIELTRIAFTGHPLALVGAGLGALIALATTYAVEPAHGFSLKPVNLARAPVACAQALLYPAALLALMVPEELPVFHCADPEPLLYGLLLWRLARTVCRRTQEESRPLNLMLVCLVALPALLAGVLPGAMAAHRAALLALICTGILFSAPHVRLWLAVVLLAAAGMLMDRAPLPGNWSFIAACLCCAAAVALNLYKLFRRRAPRQKVQI